MIKNLLAFLLFSTVTAFAQAQVTGTSVTIPSQTYTANFTFNGQTGTLTIVQPAQTITVPASGGGSIAGLTVSGSGTTAVLTFTGSIVATGSLSGTQISLTGGPTLPASGNNLYVLQAAGTPAVLSPVPLAVPVITFSQASSPVNTFNLTATP